MNIRIPMETDGADLYRLVSECPPLDGNSMYCNLLQCSHFGATSAAAEQDGELVGFISAYLLPARPDTLFIWQVAVADGARGQGLATRMLLHILSRPVCRDVRHLETTITGNNRGSWALFEALAGRLGAKLKRSVQFDRERHFAGSHDTEMLVRIGPFNPANLSAMTTGNSVNA